MKIADRIRKAYRPGIGYTELMMAVFPPDDYPRAWNYSSNGGPPGCAMAFGSAIREMGGHVGCAKLRRVVWIPTKEES
jgi:hypothetical protein